MVSRRWRSVLGVKPLGGSDLQSVVVAVAARHHSKQLLCIFLMFYCIFRNKPMSFVRTAERRPSVQSSEFRVQSGHLVLLPHPAGIPPSRRWEEQTGSPAERNRGGFWVGGRDLHHHCHSGGRGGAETGSDPIRISA